MDSTVCIRVKNRKTTIFIEHSEMGTLEELVKKISDILSLNEENIRLHKVEVGQESYKDAGLLTELNKTLKDIEFKNEGVIGYTLKKEDGEFEDFLIVPTTAPKLC
ncbi:uncharacterized protein LOC135145812 [Zophobas morio]|uniref:uncharacterized protein LOC135145812 n=1 Tax=Zophobas morio TaxID=2755281 RepID=UPI003082B555